MTTAARETPLPGYTLPPQSPTRDPLWAEWMLADGLGGYAMGTAAGLNTRRYHGLLVAAMRPPVERVIALSAVVDRLTLSPANASPDAEPFAVTLTPFHFRGAPDRPIAPPAPCSFTRSASGVRWAFSLETPWGPACVCRDLHLFRESGAAALRYTVDAPGMDWQLALRPLVALRDFHALIRKDRLEKRYQSRPLDRGVLVAAREAGVHLASPDADYRHHREYWRQIEYLWEQRRGVESVEHLMSPGEFTAAGTAEGSVTLTASIDATPTPEIDTSARANDARLKALAARTTAVITAPTRDAESDRVALAALAVAADDFVVARGTGPDRLATIIAGYPWFSDWGRDTMISLPGLLLATGRHDEAFRALRAFGDARRRGLIPNRFDDYSGPAHYNTVDASLWFLHAAAEYARASADRDGYAAHLAPACLDIIDHYRRGTDFDIRMDPADALISAGNPQTQLTWMDAQRDGVTFTPRFGKAVEINALWHHGLLATAEQIAGDNPERARELRDLADRVRDSFGPAFTNPDGGLYDRLVPAADPGSVGPNWQPVAETRPNQVFAASLEHAPLDTAQRARVVETVRTKLATPMGLRTLAPGEPGYVGRLEGSMFDRDAAYHNGTVWPWLMGPLAEAVLRAGDFDAAARTHARDLLAPLVEALSTGNTLGGLAEIYDGDHTRSRPQRPDGCIHQAWSVAETLRVMAMLAGVR